MVVAVPTLLTQTEELDFADKDTLGFSKVGDTGLLLELIEDGILWREMDLLGEFKAFSFGFFSGVLPLGDVPLGEVGIPLEDFLNCVLFDP